jgi:hypothetical protein
MAKRSERLSSQSPQSEMRMSRHPTPLPSFDMEQYARESEEDLRIAEEAPTRPRGGEHSALIETAPVVQIEDSLSDDEAQQVFWARIGDDAQVLVLVRPLEELLAEPRAAGDAHVLSAIDGHAPTATVRSIVDGCGLPALAALQALCDLLESGAITFVR